MYGVRAEAVHDRNHAPTSYSTPTSVPGIEIQAEVMAEDEVEARSRVDIDVEVEDRER